MTTTKRERGNALIFGCLLVLFAAGPALGQGAAAAMMRPDTLGEAPFAMDYKTGGAPAVDAGDDRMGWMKDDVRISAPFWQNPKIFDVSADLSFKRTEYYTDTTLPNTGEAFPSRLFDASVGLSARHEVDSGMVGASVGLRSASDRLFNSMEETAVTAGAYWLYTTGPTSSWLASLYYSSRGPFGGVPLPGLAWQYAPSKTFRTTLGVPFSMIYYRPLEHLDLTATARLPMGAMVRARYWITRELAVFTGAEISSESYWRHDRRRDEDELTYIDKQAFLGASWNLTDMISVEARAGWGFDRFWYEGEDYFSDRHDNRIDLDDGFVGELNASIKF